MKKIILLLAAIVSSTLSFAQIEYTNSPPFDAEMFAERLAGYGVDVFNAELTCGDSSSAYFWNGSTTNLGMESGIVLTTGTTEIAFSPNTVGDASGSGGVGSYLIEDFLASNLICFVGTFNACILEFDFIAYSDEINLNYIFGSEEYPEYVGSSFNDIFLVLIEGSPEYPPEMSAFERNIAIIPDGSGVNVGINYLNFGSYAHLYQDNEEDDYIQYDGQTVRLPANAKVTPGNTYHLSFMIADVGDALFDSGLFLEENSLQSNVPYLESIRSNIDENSQRISENCSEGILTFSLPFASSEEELELPILTQVSEFSRIQIIFGGTATPIEDYTMDAYSVIFPKRDELNLFSETLTQELRIIPTSDNIEEEIEYITIDIYSPHNESYLSMDTLWLEDTGITSVGDGGAICSGESFALFAYGNEGMTYEWSPVHSLDNPFISNPVASPTESTVYTVTIRGENDYEAQHGVAVNVLEAPMIDFIVSPEETCASDPVMLTVTPYTTNYTYDFYDENDVLVSGGNSINLLIYPSKTTTYTVIVTNADNCTAMEEVTVTVEDMPIELAENFIVCEGEILSLNPIVNSTDLSYEWFPSTGIDNPNSSNPSIAVDETITYTLITTSSLGCTNSIQTTIEVAEDCVYPGDADDNGKVNMFDLFEMGLHFGKSGFPRNTISNKWKGFGCYDWNEAQGNGKDLKYIDSNGNGKIGFEDTVALVYNFDLHQKNNGFTKGSLGDPELQFIPNFETIGPGETLELEVWLGSDTNPVTNLYAIAFETFFDTNLIDGNSITMNYENSSLGVVGENLLATGWINETNGRINVSLSKIDGNGISGKLYLLSIRMRTQDVFATSDFSFNITDFGATNPNGTEVLVNVDETPSVTIDPNVVGIEENTIIDKPYLLYPSFTQNGFYISHSLQKNPSIEVALFDLSGQKLDVLSPQIESSMGKFRSYIDLKKKGLPVGLYLVELKIEGKTYREKVVFY